MGGTPNGWLLMDKSSINGSFGGTPISGDFHIETRYTRNHKDNKKHNIKCEWPLPS